MLRLNVKLLIPEEQISTKFVKEKNYLFKKYGVKKYPKTRMLRADYTSVI